MAGSQSYSVDNKTIAEMLGSGSPIYSIPNFQRRFAWTDKEIGELLYDLYEEIDWTDENSENTLPYFLGSVVVASNEGVEIVLDGQQRLATILLLLAFLKQKLVEQRSTKASIIDHFLIKASTNLREPDQFKIKLQEEDAKIYETLLNDPTAYKSQEFRGSLLARAAQKISADITSKYLHAASETGVSTEAALLLMLERIMQYTTFVKIVAPSEADAFRLFETLNDRGLALNAADLIKNKFLAKCSEAKHIEDAVTVWKNIVDLVEEDEVVNFLRYYWIAFQGSARKKDLYKAFEEHLRKRTPQQALAFGKGLRNAARNYRKIIDPNNGKSPWNETTNEILKRLLVYRARICRPVLLACAEYKPEEMIIVAKACESITVRQSIVSDLSSNDLEKSYSRLSLAISDGEDVKTALVNELSKHALSDEEFAHNFSQIRINRVTETWRQILVQLNEKLATGETTVRDAKDVHVEHILPRNPTKRALEEARLSKEVANQLVEMIGNLTLLSAPMNRDISNGPFSVKQPAFATSEIALNKEIAKKSCWGEKEILERNQQLGQLAIEVWPWPIS